MEGMVISVHPETAPCGPDRCYHVCAILDAALLRLRLRKRCGYGLNHNLPFPDGHSTRFKELIE
jgi:hypothetical protein